MEQRILDAYKLLVAAANTNFRHGAITYGELKACVNTAAYMRDVALGDDTRAQFESECG